jgi:hypothetical protein
MIGIGQCAVQRKEVIQTLSSFSRIRLENNFDQRPKLNCINTIEMALVCALHVTPCLDKFKTYLESLSQDPNKGLKQAAKDGDLDLVRFFIEKGADDWSWGMEGAAFGGHMDLVKFFKNKIGE